MDASPSPNLENAVYSYISIRGDRDYAATHSIEHLHHILGARPEIRDNGDRTYSNTPGFPWICIALINCDERGNFPAGLPQDGPTVNLLECVCLDSGSFVEDQFYIDLTSDIAEDLGWAAIADETEDRL